MTPFPLQLVPLLGKAGEYLVYMLIGFGFGYALEISGFGNSRKLAAQFYFKEMTVLKVMFTAIVVAMVLIFGASALGLLDYNLIWVNPTYLWPGIVGGLIMGVGFIVGGYCPGTSLVAVSTLKLDGIFFTLGTLFGIFLFGETVSLFDVFWNSSYMGRFTIPDWLGLDTGVVVVLVILMAVFMFWGSEQLERIVGGRNLGKEPRVRYAGAGALVTLAVAVMLLGQPTIEDRWKQLNSPEPAITVTLRNLFGSTEEPAAADDLDSPAAELIPAGTSADPAVVGAKEALLINRDVQIHPGELLATMHDHKVNLKVLDVRPEADYNLFHLRGSQRVSPEDLPELSAQMLLEPANTVFVLVSNDEQAAVSAWRTLVALSVPNVYVLDGGINHWLTLFGEEDSRIQPLLAALPDQLRYVFAAALGEGYYAAYPHPEEYELEYIPKIKLEQKRGASGGGCG